MARNDCPFPTLIASGAAWAYAGPSGYVGARVTGNTDMDRSGVGRVTNGSTAGNASVFAPLLEFDIDAGGQPYTVTLQGRPTSAVSCSVLLYIYDASNTLLATPSSAAVAVAANTNHRAAVAVAALPAGTRKVRAAFLARNLPATAQLRATAARYAPVNDSALAYMDGDTAGARWTGTAHASQSTDAAQLGTLVDAFDTSRDVWALNGADVINGRGRVAAASSGGSPVYSSRRSLPPLWWPGSALLLEVPAMPGVPGDTANAQFWVRDLAPTNGVIDRAGFEYRAAENRLDLLVQTGANYTAVGKTETLPYDSVAHRWLRLRHTGTVIVWETSPDGAAWTVRRTLDAPPTWTTTRDVQVSIEASRSTGTNDYVIVDNVNNPTAPLASGEPDWVVDPASVGAVSWAVDYTAADAVAGGYQDAPWNRQSAAGNGDASGLPWAPTFDVSPFGRPGRALMLRVGDGARRFEVEPKIATEWVAGDARWIGFAFCVDGDLDRATPDYQTLWQLRPNDSNGSPPIELDIRRDGGLWAEGGYNRPNASGVVAGNTYVWTRRLANIEARRWYHVVMFVGVWSAPGSGRFEVWLDGAPVLSGFRPPPGTTFPTEATKTYPKNGIYHASTIRGCTVWFADHRHGTGYKAVDPTRAITDYRNEGTVGVLL